MKKISQRISALSLAILLLFPPGMQAQQQPQWPRTVSTPAGALSIYEPQVDSFNQATLTFHAAVSLTQSGQTTPVFGAMWFSANVLTDRDSRTVRILSLSVANSRFPQVDASQIPTLTQAIVQDAASSQPVLSLDNLVASLNQTQKEQSAAANLNNNPPQIIFTSYAAMLVTLDGPPRLSPIPSSPLMRVVNTPYLIVLDPSTSTYYLQAGGQWVSTADVVTGSWETAKSVPSAVTTYAASQANAQAAKNPSSTQIPPSLSQSIPKIIVATQPTELIQIDGSEQFSAVAGTSLLYISNTSSDVFMNINTQQLYVLLSGRWYKAALQQGPWTYIPSYQLPPDFSKIPPGSPKASVLASISGTPSATTAVLNSSVPETAAVKRNAPGPDVKYDGDPKFKSVAGSGLQYAENTSHSVIKVENSYYCCTEGIWFVGNTPTGLWTVALSVPEAIYTIPPTSPVYNVTYCYVYNSTPDVVYCGYLPGYVGSYPYGGTVVYGTGWPYQSWYGSVYIPRPVTWGYGAIYNPAAYEWGFGVGAAVGFGAGYNSGWWGAGGYHSAYWDNNNNNSWNRNVSNNFSSSTTTNNIYNRNINNNRVVQNNTNINNRVNNANGERVANRNENNAVNRINDNRNGDHENVYAGKDGNIYRHSMNGWEQHSNTDNSWRSTNESSDRDRSDFQRNVQPGLNHDAQARYDGNRSEDRSYGESSRSGNTYRSGSESRSSSGSRGGGGRR
ncbi:MAG: hypothetical protein ABI615_03575 [Chthoniobacterales bacterium]